MDGEKRLLQIAIELSYLRSNQASFAYSLYKKTHQKNPLTNLLDFLTYHKYINFEQAKVLYKSWKREKNSSEVVGKSGEFTVISTSEVLSSGKIGPGIQWGNFHILEEIGRGGMGIVYKAKQVSPERIVALKVLFVEKIPLKHRKRFLKEAQVGARLAHPNIITTYLASTYNQTPFIVVQYIDGYSLDIYCKKFQPSLEEKLSLISQIAYALDYAHKEKVIHRDVKPENILISKEKIPYLMDFGIARSFRVEDRSLTRTGEILGTPKYMSPEQIKGVRRQLDGRADVYSLGAVLYEIVTRKPVVEAKSAMQAIYKALNGEIAAPRKVKPDIDPVLEKIILKAMARNRERRYETAQLFAKDLENFLQKKPVEARQFRDYRKYRLLVKSCIISTCLLIVLLAGLVLFRDKPKGKKRNGFYTRARKLFDEGKYKLALDNLEKLLFKESKNKKLLRLKEKIFYKLKEEIWEKLYKSPRTENYIERFCRDYIFRERLSSLFLCTNQALRAEEFFLKDAKSDKLLSYKERISQKLKDQIWIVWEKLYKFSPKVEDMRRIGERAIQWGAFQDAQKYLEKFPEDHICQEKLLQLLIYTNKYSKAEKTLSLSNDLKFPVIKVLLNYHLEKRDTLLQNFNRIKSKNLTSFQKTYYFLLKAFLLWEKEEGNFNLWEWLSGKSERSKEISEKLLDIDTCFRRAKFCSEALPENMKKLVQEKILSYQKVFAWEKKIDKNLKYSSWVEIENRIQEYNLSYRKKLFLFQAWIRYLIRQKKWKEVQQACDEKIEAFPWLSNFYNLRAIAKYKSGMIESARGDILNALERNRWDFTPINNMLSILFENLSQPEFIEIFKILNFSLNIKTLEVHEFFLKKQARILLQTSMKKRSYRLNQKSLKSLFKTYFQTQKQSYEKIYSDKDFFLDENIDMVCIERFLTCFSVQISGEGMYRDLSKLNVRIEIRKAKSISQKNRTNFIEILLWEMKGEKRAYVRKDQIDKRG